MNPEDEVEKPQPSVLSQCITWLVYLLLLFPCIYILQIGFRDNSLFQWHPICMSLAAGLISIEAVFVISGEAYTTKKLSRATRVTLHWILHSVGLTLLLIGLVIIVVNKNKNGYEHFTTTHGQLGLSTIVITCVVASFGILANNARWLYPKVRPVLLKVLHAFAGIGVTILLLATLINGTYRRWWIKMEASETGRSLVFASLFIAGVIVLVKPVIGAISRSRVLARPPPSPPVAMTETTTR